MPRQVVFQAERCFYAIHKDVLDLDVCPSRTRITSQAKRKFTVHQNASDDPSPHVFFQVHRRLIGDPFSPPSGE